MAAESEPAPDVLARRLVAQGLAGAPLGEGAAGPLAVARRLLATQAQDPRGFRLAIRARTQATTGTDVDRALTEDRALLVTWLNRGTLHLVTREDYPLVQALVADGLRAQSARRLAQLGLEPDLAQRAVSLVDRWLAEDGPLSRETLRERLRRAGVPTEGQALVHVLFRASLDGVCVRGPVAAGGSAHEQLYARVADWLPEAPAATAAIRADPARGHAEVARRFLAGHGPADARDLARWLGVGLGVARAGFGAIAGELRERADGLVELAEGDGARDAAGSGHADAARPPRPPAPRLLGPFEPLLMGWRSRALVLGDHEPGIVTGGIFRGFALVRGRAAGVWRFQGAGVQLAPLTPLPASVTRALERDGLELTRFLGR